MKLAVFSHKEVWRDPNAEGGFVTVGGFPAQVRAIGDLFDETKVLCALMSDDPPTGYQVLGGNGISVAPRPSPVGRGAIRKLFFPVWMVRNVGSMMTMAAQADAIHAAVPGDIGTIGLILGLLKRKRLFVRHCGTWGDRSTLANRFLAWLLPKIAGGRVVVMATGGGPDPPEVDNPAIEWIFASSLLRAEIDRIEPIEGWKPGSQLRLVSVGRLTREKNALASIKALKGILGTVPDCTLTVVGEGPIRAQLEETVLDLDLVDAVTFTGNLGHDMVIETLLGSHIFVFPTRVAEGFPKAVLEAMACGLPVVASRVSVLPHLLGGGDGALLDGTSSSDVADSVLRLAQSPTEMAELGRRARRAVGEFTLERWRDEICLRLEDAWGVSLNTRREGLAPDARASS